MSVLPLTSCITCHKKNETPKLYWTPVPDPIYNGDNVVVYLPDTDEVKMPYWYWNKLTEYIIDTEANKELLDVNN